MVSKTLNVTGVLMVIVASVFLKLKVFGGEAAAALVAVAFIIICVGVFIQVFTDE